MTTVYNEGDFSFVEDKLHRYLLQDAYTALQKSDLWTFVKDEYDEKKATEQPEILDIFLAMKYKSHTMKTFGVVMRNMKKIALDGWDEYVKEWISTKKDH
jgi:predicted protein tyrosine phosphatase